MNSAFTSNPIRINKKGNQSSCFSQVKSVFQNSLCLVFCPQSAEAYQVVDCRECLTVAPVTERKETPLALIYIITKQNPTLRA